MNLFASGVRPLIDEYLKKKSEEERDYGAYWSASSAGYCMRKVIFDRLGVPRTREDARLTRVFEAGHIFHEWVQRITKEAGASVEQELELRDEKYMIIGHFDDLIKTDAGLVLYDYKTQSSRAFSYQKDRGMSHFHEMQLGTYMMMMRQKRPELVEGRIMKISKDDLRMAEEQLLWTPELENKISEYWTTLNKAWNDKKLPPCTCADREGGFMAKEKFNDYWYNDEPCSIEWYNLQKKQGNLKR